MVQITISSITPGTLPADGWKVRYRIKGSTGAYTVPGGSPYNSLPIVFTTADLAGTLYEIQAARDCGALESAWFDVLTPCSCTTVGYSPTAYDSCKKTTTIAATITNSGFCLVASTNAVYSAYGSRIYNPGFSNSTLFLIPGTVNAYIYGEMSLDPQWANLSGSTVNGPLNREGVFIDKDCNGSKDSLGSGIATFDTLVSGTAYTTGTYFNKPLQGGSGSGATATFTVSAGGIISVTLVNPGIGYSLTDTLTVNAVDVGGTGTGFSIDVATLGTTSMTLSFLYNNTGVPKTIYIGVGGDNQFKVVVNGVVVADTGTTLDTIQFRTWHIIPVSIISGINYFNVILLGDGSVNDSIGMVGYNNTAAQIAAATSDAALNILFKTSNLRGTTFDIASCPVNYSLDASAGSGNYTCVRIEEKPCNTIT